MMPPALGSRCRPRSSCNERKTSSTRLCRPSSRIARKTSCAVSLSKLAASIVERQVSFQLFLAPSESGSRCQPSLLSFSQRLPARRRRVPANVHPAATVSGAFSVSLVPVGVPGAPSERDAALPECHHRRGGGPLCCCFCFLGCISVLSLCSLVDALLQNPQTRAQ